MPGPEQPSTAGSSGRRIAITGASGLIGSALSTHLAARGDKVVHLVRRNARTAAEISWNPAQRRLDPACLEGVDALVHLAGAGVADHRWNAAQKQRILASRADGTAAVARAVAAHGSRLRLVSGSAIGYYGSDRGDELLTEKSSNGSGFLAEVVRVWEAATEPARAAGAAVAMSRTGLVMSPSGGAFEQLLRLARWGLAGPLGSGRQYWPWISLDDTARALTHLLDHADITGPVNVVGPDPLPQREVVREIGAQLGRPTLLPAPAFAIRALVGEFAGEILGSQRVVASVLDRSGFRYQHPSLAAAVATLV